MSSTTFDADGLAIYLSKEGDEEEDGERGDRGPEKEKPEPSRAKVFFLFFLVKVSRDTQKRAWRRFLFFFPSLPSYITLHYIASCRCRILLQIYRRDAPFRVPRFLKLMKLLFNQAGYLLLNKIRYQQVMCIASLDQKPLILISPCFERERVVRTAKESL